jgi:mRNA-degrading endonuclease RelE of RelBE toxin-antitoxin system
MMTPLLPFDIFYAPIVKSHLKAIEPKYYSLIEDSIEAQLRFEPDIETKNRKPLRRPVTIGAQWEIRFGPDNRFRIFYRINRRANRVEILAIGVKHGDRLLIGGQEVEI